ncbi:Kinesin-like protein KIP2 [Cyberlindnera fabianii]|uniref:Kinesin-like protein n=1 Tax=Cyberlindnera fabianii TaxID=36022 RepID=A0A1V2L8G3_CYBFA|nr:Kinesin-like protein KIP2 [Cyberlindnera fabianii]
MYSRSQTPRRTPATPSMRPVSSLSSRAQTPSSASRGYGSRYGERPTFTPVRERPSSSLSYSSASRPTTPSLVATSSQPYTGTISVAIRAKPSETFLKDPWYLTDEAIQHNEVGEFRFDHVFQPTSTNQEVYEKCVKGLIESLMDGYNATVFAYGMTGSGKTYSMTGTDDEPGVIPLSISEIFNRIDTSDKSIYKYDLKVSYLEIYNERIYDLLNVDQLRSSSVSGSADLKIRDVPNYGVKVIGLMEETVKNESDVLNLINKGNMNRRVGETDFNARSSRSHAIVLVRIATTNTVTGIETFSTLSLCDLAGSERATGQQERRKEGSFINKSLLALGSVIVKLSSSSTSTGHINYRDSKLTRILQPALSGESVVAVLCTIHTSSSALAETVNTVRFAARAKNISLNVRKHEIDITTEKDRIIEKLKKQVQSQQLEIENLKKRKSTVALDTSEATSVVSEDVKEQMQELSAENRILSERLEHMNRMMDEKNAQKMVLKNDIVNQILSKSADSDDGSRLILQVEELFKKTYSEIDEYKSYISHLEHQLKNEIAGHGKQSQPAQHDVSFSPSKTVNNENEVDLILKDQEDEILQLKSDLKNKERIIKALQSTKRVRDSLIHTIHSSEIRRQTGKRDPTLKEINLDMTMNTQLAPPKF